MKVNKDVFLYISIFYIMSFIVLSLNAYFKAYSKVDFDFNNDYKNDLLVYREEVKKVKNEECRIFISEMIDYVDKNKLDGEYDVDELFDLYVNDSFIDNLKIGKEKCNINEEDNKKFVGKYVSTFSTYDEIAIPYLFQYEIGFEEKFKRELSFNASKLGYNSLISNEMDLIREYINYALERGI